MSYSFVLTGGGTGGHVFPALAVGDVLRERGHQLLVHRDARGNRSAARPRGRFRDGVHSQRRTEPSRICGSRCKARCSCRSSIAGAGEVATQLSRRRQIFSTGGYVAGPVMLAAYLRPEYRLIVMEPNVVPGFANRKVGRWVYRALVGFERRCCLVPARQ